MGVSLNGSVNSPRDAISMPSLATTEARLSQVSGAVRIICGSVRDEFFVIGNSFAEGDELAAENPPASRLGN